MGDAVRTLLGTLAIVLLSTLVLTSGTYAQLSEGVGGVPQTARDNQEGAMRAEAKRRERVESENAYKKALNGIPEASKPFDPWRNVR
jgi:hypothetical protein